MANEEIICKIDALKEWEALLAEAQEQVDTLKDELKAHMNAQGLEELEAGTHIIRYSTVISNRFDSTGFKRAFPDQYKAWTKPVTSRRFSVTG